MKHLSDHDVIRKLEELSQPFKLSQNKKNKISNEIFHSKNHSKKKKSFTFTWMPTIVSLVLLLTIISGVYAIINGKDSFRMGASMKDVTASWNNVILNQESSNDLSSFYLYFNDKTLIIQDDIAGIGPSIFGKNEAEVLAATEEFAKKKEKLTLRAGEFPEYSVKKKENMYEITVPGKDGFSYTLEKIAPRKFMGEDGIQYSTGTYLE